MSINNSDLLLEMAGLIAQIDQKKVYAQLINVIRQFMPCDAWLVTLNQMGFPPKFLHRNEKHFPGNEQDYFNKIYLLDPIYSAWEEGKRGCFLLADVAPDHFTDSEYYRKFYSAYDLRDELCWAITINNDVDVVISACRTDKLPLFSHRDRQLAEKLVPLIQATVRHGLKKIQRSKKEIAATETQTFVKIFQRAFSKFATSLLTGKEVEITHLLLKGHSPKSIANILDRSAGTVRNHLASIYNKLNISSQAELFGLFLEAMSTLETESKDDPLMQLEIQGGDVRG